MTRSCVRPSAAVISPRVVLGGIGTAAPAASVAQLEAANLAAQRCCQTPEQAQWLHKIFAKCGVAQRGSILGADFPRFFPPPSSAIDRGPTTGARMEQYAALGPPLAMQACRRALSATAVQAGAITHLITTSCTGFIAPGLDVRLIKGLELSPGVHRAQVGFMGCHGAFNALGLARSIALADPQAHVLVCSLELCSLHLAYGFDPQQVIANSLFADGAAAVVVLGQAACAAKAAAATPAGGDPSGAWSLRDTASFLLPESEEAMTWRIGDHGFVMTLAATVPQFLRAELASFLGNWLAGHGLELADVGNWAVHPGGPKVLSGVRTALRLDDDVTAASAQILAEHGNMSSATIAFILERLAQDRRPGPTVAMGFGPGLMIEALLLD